MSEMPQDVELINKRIKKFKSATERKTDKTDRKFVYAYQIGSRIAADLISGVLVGAGLGYLLDKWLNTQPLCLITFLIFGGAAGFLNVYRFVKKEDCKKEEI